MTPFEFLLAYSLQEAVELLDPEDPGVRPISGGTAVMLMMKAGVLKPTRLVSTRCIGAEHSRVHVEPGGWLRIGAMARMADIQSNPQVSSRWPLLAQALCGVANPRVRSVATLGGSLAHADPHMDMPPVLAALGAQVVLESRRGQRVVPADALCTGYYETVIARDELVVAIRIPPQAGQGAYLKVTTRAAHDWPALGLAVVLQMEGQRLQAASIIAAAATDSPTRLADAQAELQRGGLDAQSIARAAEAAAAEAPVVGDAHGSAAYKRQLLRVSLPRAIQRAIGPARNCA